MQQGSAQTIASFTGTLLRREHTLGEKFVRLVFRENDKDVLCVSTNPRTAMLPIGQAYRVEGAFQCRGEQAFVLNPKIADLKKHWRPIKRVLFGVVLVGCVAGFGGVAYMQHGDAATPAGTSVQPTVKSKTASPATPASAPVIPAAATAPAPAPAVTKPRATVRAAVKTTVSVPAAQTPAAPAATPPAANNPAVLPGTGDNPSAGDTPDTDPGTDAGNASQVPPAGEAASAALLP